MHLDPDMSLGDGVEDVLAEIEISFFFFRLCRYSTRHSYRMNFLKTHHDGSSGDAGVTFTSFKRRLQESALDKLG